MTKTVIGPKSKKQEMFLNSDADVVIFGGGAGSGKSYLGAMDMLKYVHDKNFRGLVMRRLTPQIHGPGGIFETFVNLHRLVFGDKLKVKKRDGILEYPSGATITFRHCQYEEDKYSIQGWQISAALVDESQQLSGSVIQYAMSRLRSEANMKPVMRMTCNPLRNSYVHQMVEWYLDEEGFPIEERCGVKRWFVLQDNTTFWYDSLEDAKKAWPAASPLSFAFINANVFDNPVLMERQPEYVGWLEGLPRIERARLLDGNWLVSEQAAGYWKKEFCEIVDFTDSQSTMRVRAWDLAATLPSEVNTNPDWTAGTLMSKSKDKSYFVEDVQRFRDRFAGVEQRIIEQAHIDGHKVLICIPNDPGSGAQSYARSFQAKLAELGFTVRLVRPKADKVTRFGPFAAMSEAGFVKIVRGSWNEDYFAELENFTGAKKDKDD